MEAIGSHYAAEARTKASGCENCGHSRRKAGVSFAKCPKQYGELGRNYARVHHKDQLSKAPKTGKEVALADLAIVCANRHAMIHLGGECRDIDSLVPSSKAGRAN